VFIGNLNLLQTILRNIVKDPTNKKFQRLRLSNDKLKKLIVDCEQTSFILELLGFQRALLPPPEMIEGGDAYVSLEDYYVLLDDRLDVREFETLITIIDQLQVNLKNLPPLN
jgi:hypothetical protein